MTLDSGFSASSGGGAASGREIFLNLTSHSKLSPSVKKQIMEHAGRIYTMIDAKSGNLDDLNMSIALLTNLFRTHTHSSHTDLTYTEKLMFQYAFIDITDDVRTALTEWEGEQEEQSTMGWIAAKVVGFVSGPEKTKVSAEELLEAIDEFQEAMKDPDLEISLSRVKEFLGLVLSYGGDTSKSQEVKVKEMNLKQLVDFLDQKHREKVQASAKQLEKGKETEETSYVQLAFETLGQAMHALLQVDMKEEMEKIRQPLVQQKDQFVKETVSGFKPEAIFEGRTFSQVTADLVESQLEGKNLKKTPLALVARTAAESVRGNLAANLERIADERNLARVGIKINERIGSVFEALHELELEATDEELLAKLGYKGTIEQYKTEVENRGAESIAKLISKNPTKTSSESKNFAVKIWKSIFRGISNTKRKMIRSFYETAIQGKSANLLMKHLAPIADKIGGIRGGAAALGLEEEVEKVEKHSDIILLYLLDGLVEEMADIVVESEGKSDVNVSGFATKEEASKVLHSSVSELGKKMSVSAPKESSSLSQKCLFQLVSLFGPALAQAQGSGDSAFDVVTPAVQELGPAWRDWLTK